MRLPIIAFLLFSYCSLFSQSNTVELTESVYFASASANLRPEAKTVIAEFTEHLSGYADFTIQLEAFTDEQGENDFNDELATERAASVKAFLEASGISTDSWSIAAYGERLAKVNTIDDTQRKTDRRVDLVATVTTWDGLTGVFSRLRSDLPQQLTIDPTQNQTVIGEKGGRFLLEANSLVDADGTPASGPVTIELIEAYTLDDMLLAGLTTTSGDQTLETGGMFKLTAVDEAGNPLSLAEGKTMASAIPTENFNPEMQIFNGQHGEDSEQLDWSLTPMQVSSSTAGLLGMVYDGPVLARWEFDLGIAIAAWKKNNPEPELALRPVSSNRKKPEQPDTNTIRWEPNLVDGLFASKEKRARMRRELVVKAWDRYEHQQEVYAKRLRVSAENSAYNAQARADFPAIMEVWETALEAEKNRLRADNKAKNEALRADYKKRREAWLADREANLEASLSGNDLTGKGGELSQYFFTVNKLGWINCDIFYGEEDPIMVKAAMEGNGEGAKVILIPEGRRSMLPYYQQRGGFWGASGVPRNTSYKVVAYQISDGQLQYAEQDIAAASTEVEKLAFRPVSVPELKERLTGLSSAK